MTWMNTAFLRMRKIKTFDSLRVQAYRMYFFGMIGQWSTFSMEMVARTYLIYDITGSAAKLAIMSLANAIPIIVLSLFGGAIADKLSKKRLIMLAQIAMSVVSLGNAIAINVGYLGSAHPESWWVLVVGAVCMGTIVALVMPSRQAIIPELVAQSQIMNAISLNTMGMSFFQLVGPATAGFVIDAFGYAVVFYIMTALNISGIVFAVFLPDVAPSQAPRRSVLSNVSDGFRYILGHRTVLLLLALFVSAILLAMPYQMLMPVFAKDILKVGVSGQGILMSVAGIGAFAASLVLASLPSKRRGITLLLANFFLGMALVVFAFSVSWPLSIGMMLVVGMGLTGNNTAGAALLQSYTEPEYLGRVMSIMSMSFGLSGLGTFFAGMLAESVSAQWAIGGLAAMLVVIMLGVFLLLPRIRKLD
jgi:MFS family permease